MPHAESNCVEVEGSSLCDYAFEQRNCDASSLPRLRGIAPLISSIRNRTAFLALKAVRSKYHLTIFLSLHLKNVESTMF